MVVKAHIKKLGYMGERVGCVCALQQENVIILHVSIIQIREVYVMLYVWQEDLRTSLYSSRPAEKRRKRNRNLGTPMCRFTCLGGPMK